MAKQTKDDAHLIHTHTEIIVDSHSPEEQAMGRYTHLSDILRFLFSTWHIAHHAISPKENMKVFG